MEAVFDITNWTDEFHRSVFWTTILAAVFSTAKALLAATAVFAIGFLLVLVSEVRNSRLIGGVVRLLLDALESVPAFIWILAAVGILQKGGFITITIVFAFAALPLVYNFIVGVVKGIMSEEYYAAAIALGVGKMWLLTRHILPNALPLCVPPFFFVVGSAIAVYGAIGLFGFVNRRELDLGVFVLRGTEQASTNPTILVASLAAYISIFVLLKFFFSQNHRVGDRTIFRR